MKVAAAVAATLRAAGSVTLLAFNTCRHVSGATKPQKQKRETRKVKSQRPADSEM
jgi:hypothetical protein